MLFGKFELTDEMVARAKKTEAAEELMKLAQEYEISLTEDDARQIQLFLSGGELSDDNLTAVAGGKGGGAPKPKYNVNQRVVAYHLGENQTGTIAGREYVELQKAWYYDINFDLGDKKSFPEDWVTPI